MEPVPSWDLLVGLMEAVCGPGRSEGQARVVSRWNCRGECARLHSACEAQAARALGARSSGAGGSRTRPCCSRAQCARRVCGARARSRLRRTRRYECKICAFAARLRPGHGAHFVSGRLRFSLEPPRLERVSPEGWPNSGFEFAPCAANFAPWGVTFRSPRPNLSRVLANSGPDSAETRGRLWLGSVNFGRSSPIS